MNIKDYRGPWNTFVGPNTPLYAPNDTSVDKTYNIDFTVNYYMFLGMPKEKIVLGLVAYGHSWTLANSSITSMYSSASGPGAPFNVGFFNYQAIYLCRKKINFLNFILTVL